MQKKIILIGAIVITLITAGGIYWNQKNQKEKAASMERVTLLSQQVQPLKTELIDLYQKRYDLLLSWHKATGSKSTLPIEAPSKVELKTEQDLQAYDLFQMQITNQFSAMLTRPEFMKRIKELEVIEHQINRKRNEYHSLAIEADDLIQKYKTGQSLVPVFPAEKLLHQEQNK